MDLGLRDRVVAVTGGTSGIGRATVAALLAEGARVATFARRPDRVEALAGDLGADDGQLLAVPADVRDKAQVEAFFAAVAGRFGQLDGLVNNAGESRMKAFAEATDDDWRDELELKFGGVINPLVAALDLLKASDAAAVVNVNAALAVEPSPRLVTTSAARAGVLNLSKSLARDLAASGIRVNSVLLGLVDSGQWRRRYDDSGSDATYDEWMADVAAARDIPAGRLGRPEEVAAMITVLVSPAASYVTGAGLEISGGITRGFR